MDERHLYQDKASGARDDRPGLKACLEYLKAGDTLVVWKLDRLGRSLPNLLSIVTDLKARGVAFRSLTEATDTTTPPGELLFSIFGALAQYERELTRERVVAGLAAAHAERGADRTDHGRARRRSQQGVGVPNVQGPALDAARHAQTGGLDRPGQGLTGAPSRWATTLSVRKGAWVGRPRDAPNASLFDEALSADFKKLPALALDHRHPSHLTSRPPVVV